jgi:hypothetical protein
MLRSMELPNAHTGNNVLDAGRLIGFSFEISIDTNGAQGSSSTGAFYLDRLECQGNVFAAGLADPLYNVTYETPDSEWARNNTNITRHPNGYMSRSSPVLEWDFATEWDAASTWQKLVGWNKLFHFPARNMRYSWGTATHLSFWYNTLRTSWTHMYLVVYEGSNCVADCHLPANNEVYVSLNYNIPSQSTPGWHQVVIEITPGAQRHERDFQHADWYTD